MLSTVYRQKMGGVNQRKCTWIDLTVFTFTGQESLTTKVIVEIQVPEHVQSSDYLRCQLPYNRPSDAETKITLTNF